MNQQQLIVRWVKASERLPQNNGEYLCRYVHPEASCYRGAAYLLYSDGQFYAEDEMANLEWLEEGGMQGEGERQWISVKDRLPEPYQDVLGWIAYKEEIRSVYHTGSAWLNDDLGTPTVTHWMPEPHKPQTEHE